MSYPVPAKGASMKEYAILLIKQIDTTSDYSFIGVSLGGMLCSELAEILHPKKIIIISSAKCRKELPFRYRFQKSIPIYKLFPKGMIKFGARILQPIVEPDRKKNKATFKSMLKNKNATFLKRSVNMIIRWDKKTYHESIIHIHGTKDHTLPIRKTKPTIVVEKGSHMMTLTRAKEIEKIVNSILLQN
ncbi:MAG: alpha/beta hydrolase [Bacteroidetes bacterium]|nr:alpha/beta hydrolase [Bacteroidota bacterium]